MTRILLDCDGVLADFIGPVLELVREHTGREHARADVTGFGFAAALKLSADENRIVTDAISNRAGWWSSLPVLPGAREGVARLRELGEVYIVTSPWNSCATWLHEREAWLKKHFDIPHSRVLAGSAKHLVAGQWFVDDKTSTLHDWQSENDGVAVQWATPHNRRDGWLGPSTSSWEQLTAWVKEASHG